MDAAINFFHEPLRTECPPIHLPIMWLNTWHQYVHLSPCASFSKLNVLSKFSIAVNTNSTNNANAPNTDDYHQEAVDCGPLSSSKPPDLDIQMHCTIA